MSQPPENERKNCLEVLGIETPDVHLWKSTWNTTVKVWFKWLSFSIGWFPSFMLIFRGVTVSYCIYVAKNATAALHTWTGPTTSRKFQQLWIWIIFKRYLIWSSNGQVDRNYHLGICSNRNSWIVENQLTILGRLLEVNFIISQHRQQTWTCHMFQKPNGTYGSYWKCAVRDMLHPGYQKKYALWLVRSLRTFCKQVTVVSFQMFFNITMWHNTLPVVFVQHMKLHTLQLRLTTHQHDHNVILEQLALSLSP